MQFSRIALLISIFASASVMSHVLTERQTDCSTYGEYPEYTGPCSDTGESENKIGMITRVIKLSNLTSTDCGKDRTNCYAKYQDCVSYPSKLLSNFHDSN